MNLHDLVRIRRDLDGLCLSDYETETNHSLHGLRETLYNKDPGAKQMLSGLAQAQEQINNQFANIRQNISDYKNCIQSEIDKQSSDYYKISEEIYAGTSKDSAEYVLNTRKQSLTLADKDNRDLFLSRLGMYNSWKYPAIEIRPAHGEITEHIKGCDPLYLVDTNPQMFQQVQTKWHEQYQRRLRYYVIDEMSEHPLQNMPANQFGLITSVDFFNFRTLNAIARFLREFYRLLRPGGIVMFTYNNCDLPYAVRNVDNRFCCYTPGHRVIDIAQNTGFELIKSFDKLENISWLELRKPGAITTLRGGQTLGEIRSFN